ncbi:hypothetical protein JXM83_00755 [Candidatus Woesearchaeota archaeon]|nr:hypothetical protein [Candidatus Woesearchaeota archaeon]
MKDLHPNKILEMIENGETVSPQLIKEYVHQKKLTYDLVYASYAVRDKIQELNSIDSRLDVEKLGFVFQEPDNVYSKTEKLEARLKQKSDFVLDGLMSGQFDSSNEYVILCHKEHYISCDDLSVALELRKSQTDGLASRL